MKQRLAILATAALLGLAPFAHAGEAAPLAADPAVEARMKKKKKEKKAKIKQSLENRR